MSQALYRKWRPHQWDQVVGQSHVVRTLQNAIRTDRVGHAYLFAGPRGTGKTTTARLLAKAVNCLSDDLSHRPCDQCENCIEVNENRFMDLIEIDAASNTSVDDIRELREKINFSPNKGVKKIYIIDEVHMLSTAAFNALLKTLEEPPPHAIFILATTEIHKIPATVLSRCQRHEFRRIPVNDTVLHLKQLCTQENIDIDDESLKLIARQSTGSLRDAISLLDQLSSTTEKITLENTQNLLGTATNQMVIEMIDALLEQHTPTGFEIIHKTIDSGNDARQFSRQIVEYLRDILLVHMGNADQIDATQETRSKLADHARKLSAQNLLGVIKAFNTAAADSRSSWYPGLNLELAFAESLEIITSPQMNSQPAAPAINPTNSAITSETSPAISQNLSTNRDEKSTATVQPPSDKHHEMSKAQDQETVQSQAAPPQVPVPQGEALDLNAIIKNWARIRALVKKQRGQTEGLLNSCKPLKYENGTLVLGFASDVLKSKMEDGKNIALTIHAIHHLLGVEISIVCAVTGLKSDDGMLDIDTDRDGMVGEALNLGGQIRNRE